MKTLFIIPLVLMSLISFSCHAFDLQKGYAAYEAEDYSTALSHLAPLAENGDAIAEGLIGRMFF